MGLGELEQLWPYTSEWFDICRGVRQGCVIVPLLFNIYFDCVVRLSLAEMPEGCGVRLTLSGKLRGRCCLGMSEVVRNAPC